MHTVVLVGEVRVDDADSGVVEVLFKPVGGHENAGIRVAALVRRDDIHRIRQFNSLLTEAARKWALESEAGSALAPRKMLAPARGELWH